MRLVGLEPTRYTATDFKSVLATWFQHRRKLLFTNVPLSSKVNHFKFHKIFPLYDLDLDLDPDQDLDLDQDPDQDLDPDLDQDPDPDQDPDQNLDPDPAPALYNIIFLIIILLDQKTR